MIDPLANKFRKGSGEPSRSVHELEAEREGRLRAEDSLRQSEELFRLLVEGVQDYAIFLLDPGGRVATWNLGAERIKGYGAAEVIGRHFSLFYPQEAVRRGWPEHELEVAAAEGRFEDEGWRVRKDGSLFWANVIITAIHDGGRLRGFSKVTRDLTERKRGEEELEERVQQRTAELTRANEALRAEIARREQVERALRASEERLAAADRRRTEFLATLAHELRNPLAPIRHSLELLQRADDDPEMRRQARGVMERQLGQLVRLVDDLLDVARITNNKLLLRQQRIELAAAIQAAVETIRPLIEESGHELVVTLPPEPVYLDADLTRLAQVFTNLLNNAAKYTEKGGRVWLTAGRQGGDVVITVRDTGIGITAEHLPHLFEIFSQVMPALERSEGGLGIGLSLVRGVVELHGGRVEARSAGPGTGSEFVVHLPAAEGPAAPDRRSAAGEEERPGSGPKHRILVADDNQDSADSLGFLLELNGYEVRTAHDGAEAVQAAETFRPDVALLDIGMPHLNGYEAARRIRQQPWGKEMALVAVTGWGQDEDKRRAMEAGFDHHLIKPLDPADLKKLLASLVGHPLATTEG